MQRMSWVFPVIASLVCGVAFAGDRPPYSAEQLSLIRQVEECKLSPDGKTVAFVTDITGALELWTVDAGGGWPRQVSNLQEQVTDIHWSPDGRWLIFASDYGGNERRDLCRVPAAGGQVEKLTDTRLSESEPRFSPDGGRLAFTADPDADFRFDLFVMDLQTREPKRLTKEPVNVLQPLWSPDGKTIAVTRSGDEQKGDLLLVDVSSGTKVVVTPPIKDGIAWPAAFAPDGQSLLLLARNQAGFQQLAVLKLAKAEEGGSVRPAGPPEFIGPGDWDVTQARWTDKGIYFLRNEGGASSLNFLAGPTEKTNVLVPAVGMMSQLSFDKSGESMALLQEDSNRPADVWVGSPAPKESTLALKQVTFSLLGGVKPAELAKGEMVQYASFDKKKIHALVLKPPAVRLGSPPPAIVYVHGGPNGQVKQSFNPQLQVLAEAGFMVIAPNYRGSTGYGQAFEDANNKDWGGGDLQDLVAAVEHFAARGDIDRSRVGVTGGSYGGYMTLMALSKTPRVWAAGVERYGMPDLVMDYLLAKSRFADWYETEMGNPRTHAALFRERSPLLYLDDIQAPLLIFQGANDTNVPKSESDLLVSVLKELKKPHEYIIYDDEGHGFTRRKNLLDCHQRTAAFFVKHLGVKRK